MRAMPTRNTCGSMLRTYSSKVMLCTCSKVGLNTRPSERLTMLTDLTHRRLWHRASGLLRRAPVCTHYRSSLRRKLKLASISDLAKGVAG